MLLQEIENRIFNGDIADLLPVIPPSSVDCVFADPDYNVGVRYNHKSYKRKFQDYIAWLVQLSEQFHRVLKDDGNLFIINYPRNNAYLRVARLDELFQDVREYVWVYNTNVGHHQRHLTTAHRSILHCTKSSRNKFFKDHVAQPYQNPTDKRIIANLKAGSKGRMPYSWLYFDLVKNVSREKTFHSCQIPEKLSETLILAATLPGDLVLIPFGGSGSEISVCIRNTRKFIAAEIDTLYYQMIEDRINREGAIDAKYKLIQRDVNGAKKASTDIAKQMSLVLETKETYSIFRTSES